MSLQIFGSNLAVIKLFSSCIQVIEARASSERSQVLLKNVAERKKQKQAQKQGLVILAAIYGDIKAYERGTNLVDKSASTEDDDADLPPPYLDVAIPVQFLVDDFGQLRVCVSHALPLSSIAFISYHFLYFNP